MNHDQVLTTTNAMLRIRTEDVAVQFVKDWTVWGWLIAVAIGIAAVLVALAAPFVAAYANEARHGMVIWILLVIVTSGAAGVLLILPGTMMRHVYTHAVVWWVVIPWVAVALFFLWWGAMQLGGSPLSWAGYVPAILIGAGVLVGAGYDALNRFASWIPATVGAVVLAFVLGGLFLYLKARE
ncbi:MAG: hypothetical protein JSS74_10785 [Actinobacteria bacterium]|nr:hypothetical protein [Actinomycetota bacterium]